MKNYIKRSFACLLVLILILSVNTNIYAAENAPLHGRLYIPDVDIDVALYYSISQEITDAYDSANIFKWKDYSGETIADHAGQSFHNLHKVNVGTKGYIKLTNGDIIRIKCIDTFDGYNAKNEGVKDMNGNSAHGKSDYMMYTCKDTEGISVFICLWNIDNTPNNALDNNSNTIISINSSKFTLPKIENIIKNIKIPNDVQESIRKVSTKVVKKINIDWNKLKFNFNK